MKGLSIHLTDMCNQSCKFCVVDSYKETNYEKSREISEENRISCI